LVFLNH